MSTLINGLTTANQILTAGIIITAFALSLYALTFNLTDRVARSFAALLAFVTIIYFCDAVVSTLSQPGQAEVWLRLQWIGIAFVPAAYLHFSDALLATTGQPSRGRRRLSIRILYVNASVFLIAATLTNILVSGDELTPGTLHLSAGPLFPVFILYFAGCLGWAAWNFLRAYRRCQTSTTRRRMAYLMTSAVAPALGAFPFLLVVGQAVVLHPLTFGMTALATNLAVAGLLIVMAYAVAYFGVAQPDRVVKARLFQWLLRGPLVASTVLAVYVIVNRYGPRLPYYDPRALPFFFIGVLLLLQFFITMVRLPMERRLFYGPDKRELRRLQALEARLLTSDDLRQFLESVLAALCDALRTPSAFIAALNADGKFEYEVNLGQAPETELPPLNTLRAITPNTPGPRSALGEVFEWGEYWVMPLRGQASDETLGLLGLRRRAPDAPPLPPTADDRLALTTLATRAASALEDRRLQQEVFQALDRLLPQIEAIQRLRASAAYSGTKAFTADNVISDPDLAHMVKDAFTHYWGGPKLTSSPLMDLRIVRRALNEHDGNAVNALRSVLQQAVDRIKPEGQRKFTAEWILYNILEMKFLENRRVREVAMRLAVSEADLYRKQRVAMEEVARAIIAMEKEAAERATDYEVAG